MSSNQHRKLAASTKPPSYRTWALIKLLAQQGNLCGICGGHLTLKQANIDHIMPRSRGGTDLISNLQATHIACNSAKADKWDWGDILSRPGEFE